MNAEEKPLWYLRKGSVWTAILLVGPFALPLIWRSPGFGRGAKLFLTVLLLLLTLFSIYGGFILADLMARFGLSAF